MFEKEITSGNHVSYHFCVDKFADNFHPKSRQHDIEKQLRYVHIDLSPYELGITSSNTTSDGDYIHVSYLRRLNNGFMRQEVLDYFNEVTGRKYQNPKGLATIMNKGYSLEDIKKVILYKAKEWMGTEMQKYLRPETLFRESKFEGYLNDANQQVNEIVPVDNKPKLTRDLTPEDWFSTDLAKDLIGA